MKNIKYWVMSILIAIALSGCANLDVGNNPSTKLVVQYSTLKLIQQSDDVSRENVVSVAQKAKRLVSSDEEVVLSNLKQEIVGYVDISKLEPSDVLLFLTLVQTVESYVKQEYEDGVVTNEMKAKINVVLNWILEASTMTY